MAKRQRDYKAEYAREKQRALSEAFSSARARKKSRSTQDFRAAGYKSFEDYVKARQEAARWSENKSRQSASAFNPSFGAQKTRDYSNAFSAKSKSHTQFIEQLAAYLHELDPEHYPDESDAEFWNNY